MILGMTTFTAVHVLLSVIGSGPAFALTKALCWCSTSSPASWLSERSALQRIRSDA
jgi:hypothetical protein